MVEKTLSELEKAMLKEEHIDVSTDLTLSIKLDILNEGYKIEPPQPFTTEQMINKLKENKLFFPESSSMKKCVDLLNTLGYYNLKYFIKNEFEKNEEKNFDSVYTLYEFDRYLSKQLYSLLNILEVHLRNLILEVYLIEIEDRELPPALFYLDKKIYFQKEGESYKITSKKRQNFNRLQAKFSNSVNQKKNDENIKHNLDKYGIIPAWVLFQKLSFGELAMFYTNTQTKNKKLVCKKIESLISENIGKEIKVPKEIFESWFNNIRYLRNKIAHTDVIYGVNFTKSCSGHASDKEYLNRLQKFHYQQRLITFLLAMQKLFMSMPEYCRDIWNSTIEDIQVKANENSSIKLARIGVLDNDMSYLKI